MTQKFAFPRPTYLGVLLFALALGHAAFAWKHRDLRTDFDVLTPPPSRLASQAMAGGDKQFIYRVWALDLQNAGDTGGRATPMRNYNYDFVMGWLEVLRALDARAQQHAFLAGNYFSLSQNAADVRRTIAFLADEADGNPAGKWIWMARGVEIALVRLKDVDLALALSQRLAAYDVPSMTFTVATLPAVLLERLGRYAEARVALKKAIDSRGEALSAEENLWTQEFISRLPKE